MTTISTTLWKIELAPYQFSRKKIWLSPNYLVKNWREGNWTTGDSSKPIFSQETFQAHRLYWWSEADCRSKRAYSEMRWPNKFVGKPHRTWSRCWGAVWQLWTGAWKHDPSHLTLAKWFDSQKHFEIKNRTGFQKQIPYLEKKYILWQIARFFLLHTTLCSLPRALANVCRDCCRGSGWPHHPSNQVTQMSRHPCHTPSELCACSLDIFLHWEVHVDLFWNSLPKVKFQCQPHHKV